MIERRYHNRRPDLVNPGYDMLKWMVLDQSVLGAVHLLGFKPDGSVAHPLYASLYPGLVAMIKGNHNGQGWPWDLNPYDANYIYLGTTELNWNTAKAGKKYVPPIPFARRYATPSDRLVTADSPYRIYTSCSQWTLSNSKQIVCELWGPYQINFGGDLAGPLETLVIAYRWGSKDGSVYPVKEEFYFAQPYGWVKWTSSDWDPVKKAYLPPNNSTVFNKIVPGQTNLYNPCGF